MAMPPYVVFLMGRSRTERIRRSYPIKNGPFVGRSGTRIR